MKKRIGVIFGGRSGEHEISIRSAKTVVEQIDRAKYEVIPLGISEDGAWLSPAESAGLLPDSVSEALPDDLPNWMDTRMVLAGDPGLKGLISHGGSSVSRPLPIDVAFPVLHGTFGEDGTIQGLFEMADIPYVGCGVLASAGGMDKVTMKVRFKAAGLPLCKYAWFTRNEWERSPEAAREQSVAAVR